jgi:hypothetical protein
MDLKEVIIGHSPLGYEILFILGLLLIVPVALLEEKQMPSREIDVSI